MRWGGPASAGPTRLSPAGKKSFVSEPRCPYRKPTQVGGGKCPKVIGIPSAKELGKLTP